MLSSDPVPSSLYNTLSTIEQQSPPSQLHLGALGKLLVSHGVNEHLGVSLLHRHSLLRDESVMINKGLRCIPVHPTVDRPFGRLTGTNFFLHNGTFQAFEYEEAVGMSNNGGDIPLQFLEKLASYLSDNGLEKEIALSRLALEHPKLMEHCEEDHNGITSHVCEIIDSDISYDEATEWKFDVREGFVVPLITRGCARTSSGDHKKK